MGKREPRYLESSIWGYNPATQALTAQWINPNGDEPDTIIILAEHSSYCGPFLCKVSE